MGILKASWLLFMIICMVNSIPTQIAQNELQSLADEIADDVQSMEQNEEADDNPGNSEKEDIADKDDLQNDPPDNSRADNTLQEEVETEGNPNNKGFIKSGDIIALQTYNRGLWASCAAHYCGRSGCPRMQMNGNDWLRCWGEVFQIYRRKGPGVVRVGDYVGLHYPRKHGHWLGCAGHKCVRAPCPGTPNIRYGFNNPGRWRPCWGEVFRIYAKGKGHNAIVSADDDVAFYMPTPRSWVAQGHQMKKVPCLGNHLPPPLTKYDGCSYETFTIWKKTC